MYLHGGYDEDGDVIAIENLPGRMTTWRMRSGRSRRTRPRLSILVAQGRTKIGDYEIRVVVRELAPDDGDIEDPASNPLYRTDTD